MKPRQQHLCRGGETADAVDSKSTVGNHMRVQVPPSAPNFIRKNYPIKKIYQARWTPLPNNGCRYRQSRMVLRSHESKSGPASEREASGGNATPEPVTTLVNERASRPGTDYTSFFKPSPKGDVFGNSAV